MGIITYTEVRAFLKKQPHIMTQCKSISTPNDTLTLTPNHIVYARKFNSIQCKLIFPFQKPAETNF